MNTDYIFLELDVQREFARLQHQERTIDWLSQGALMRLGLGAGKRCLEVGVGAGSMFRWMAGQVGPTGAVVGLDMDAQYFPASDGCGGALRQGDVRTVDLEASTFDFAHCRLLLMHLPPEDQSQVLSRLMAALKPGGWLIALDPALAEQPPIRARGDELLAQFTNAVLDVTAAHADFNNGTRLTQLLIDAGYTEVEATQIGPVPVAGSIYATYLDHSISTVAEPFVVATGRMTPAQVAELQNDVRGGTLRSGYPCCITWGRRPL